MLLSIVLMGKDVPHRGSFHGSSKLVTMREAKSTGTFTCFLLGSALRQPEARSEVSEELGFSLEGVRCVGKGAEQATRAKSEARSKEQDGIKAKKIILVLSHPSATAPKSIFEQGFHSMALGNNSLSGERNPL